MKKQSEVEKKILLICCDLFLLKNVDTFFVFEKKFRLFLTLKREWCKVKVGINFSVKCVGDIFIRILLRVARHSIFTVLRARI